MYYNESESHSVMSKGQCSHMLQLVGSHAATDGPACGNEDQRSHQPQLRPSTTK